MGTIDDDVVILRLPLTVISAKRTLDPWAGHRNFLSDFSKQGGFDALPPFDPTA